MIAEIQVLPNPPGAPDDYYQHVDAAIAAIDRAGLTYEVGALGTTIEGDPDQIWALLRDVHDACLGSGPTSLVTVIKVHEAAPSREQASIASLTSNFRAADAGSGASSNGGSDA